MAAIFTKTETDLKITYTPIVKGETATYIINKDPNNLSIRVVVPNDISEQSVESIILTLDSYT